MPYSLYCIALCVFCVCTQNAHADFKTPKNFAANHDASFSYDPNYATDFAACPQHFAKQVVQARVRAPIFELCYTGFALGYSSDSKTAVFVAEYLTPERIRAAKKLPRVDSFRAEPRLPPNAQAQLSDYKKSGYDRGHLAPNGDMADKISQYDSFSLANIVPQNSEHNRGLWANIENHVRTTAQKNEGAYVVTGTVYEGTQAYSLHGIAVPTHLYKAVYLPKQNLAAVYYSPNDATQSYELMDVAAFYKRTGIDPFVGTNPEFSPTPFMLKNHDPTQQDYIDVLDYIIQIAQILIQLWQNR